MDPDKTLTVAQLRRKLEAMPDDADVQVWLPGTYINLANVFENSGKVLIEGNYTEETAKAMGL
jgi:hypothetical protein